LLYIFPVVDKEFHPVSGYTDGELRSLVQILQQRDPALVSGLKSAFKNKTFSYGTSGKAGGGLRLGGIMAKSINDAAKQGSRGYAFQTGIRQTAQRANNSQMMDMYYGDGGDIIHRVDPYILRFVMYAAKLRPWPGPGIHVDPWPPLPNGTQPADHPYFAFAQRGVTKAWDPGPITTQIYGNDDWGNPLTGTKELSRIIRWCVGEFGGTITFEGAEVYYNQVFKNTGRLSDTDVEARCFFAFFLKGLSRATFGRGHGTVIFHWRGVETVPSKLHFLTSWAWSSFASDQWYKVVHPENFEPTSLGAFRNPAFSTPSSATPKPKYGSGVYTTTGGSKGYQLKTKGVTIEESTIEKLSTTLGMDHINLWNNFSTFPPGVMPWTVGNWLKQLLAA
jgi:hypothetical protein